MKNNIRLLVTSVLVLGFVSVSANAALVSRLNGQAVYDTDLNITWLSDANYAQTSGYDADGRLSWYPALEWIGTLNTSNYLGFSNWRLPTTMQPDATCSSQEGTGDSFGYNCSGSELGHLFYIELSGVAGRSVTTSGDPDLVLFRNFQDGAFLSGTTYAGNANWA